MATLRRLAQALLVILGLTVLVNGCVVEPREGFYDRDHHRWWHEHHWLVCGDRDEHCHD
jgi:hypothetical protein